MSLDDTPPWLLAMRSLDGLKEDTSSGSNPRIMAMADTIAQAYPEMAPYCATYTNDDIAWCGLAAAYTMTVSNIRPVFGPTDTDRFLWAQAWNDPEWGTVLDVPRLGCVVVLKREGGGHVTYYERTEGSSYVCCGGNQSDMVKVSSYPISDVIALLWPGAAGPVPLPPRSILQKGSTGDDVIYLQISLQVPADGEFGAVTEGAVKGFQRAHMLDADGVVGPQTWSKIDTLTERLDLGEDGLPDKLAQDIIDLAMHHPVMDINWQDRGKAPNGYLAGLGQVYASVMYDRDYFSALVVMAEPPTCKNPDTDALDWYAAELNAANLIATDNIHTDTLRRLFVLLIGLGMRESSGRYCEGRDMSADNVSADTAEAGMFQTSWNIKTCDASIPPLLEMYIADPNGFNDTFTWGVNPDSNDLDNFGSGAGCQYQFLAKYAPAFHAIVTAVGLRKRRQHWGPINRREVEVRKEVDGYLRDIELLMQKTLPSV
jgi:uncharacterized protein (TIGR02594 family)